MTGWRDAASCLRVDPEHVDRTTGGVGLPPWVRERRRGYAMTVELGPRLDDEVEGCLGGAPDACEAGAVKGVR